MICQKEQGFMENGLYMADKEESFLDLTILGWNESLAQSFQSYKSQDFVQGRVYVEHTRQFGVYTENGDMQAEVSGKFMYQARGRQDFPVVGDWVALKPTDDSRAVIHAILPRRSKFSRKVAGQITEEQIVAANIDTVFLVMALNDDFNTARLYRYLLIAWESGANPVVVLTKADLCDDLETKKLQVDAVGNGVPIHCTSSIRGSGFAELRSYLGSGQTVALLGSSGVGKSTLTNLLLGEELQRVQGLRHGGGKGRHTTTHRELLLIPGGGSIIDTPGMRELQLWDGDEGMEATFPEIAVLAQSCRFSDCSHQKEPGCAVQEALERGELSWDEYHNYLKLQKELAFIEAKQANRLRTIDKARGKEISKIIKEMGRNKR